MNCWWDVAHSEAKKLTSWKKKYYVETLNPCVRSTTRFPVA